MKKIFVIFLLISVLFMYSCNIVETNNEQTDDNSQNENSTEQSEDTQDKSNEGNPSDVTNGGSTNSGGGSACLEGFSLGTYDEYLEYIENNELPDGFIFYDDIKQFGEFESLAAPGGIRIEEA